MHGDPRYKILLLLYLRQSCTVNQRNPVQGTRSPLCQKEGSRKPRATETKWEILAAGLCWWSGPKWDLRSKIRIKRGLLLSLRTDCIENTAYNSSSIVAWCVSWLLTRDGHMLVDMGTWRSICLGTTLFQSLVIGIRSTCLGITITKFCN
jgi:hypothetical protein